MAISLKIKGNKRANEGIGNDLVSIGDNRIPVNDAQYPGTKGATDFIVIRHLHDKSIYTIVCKNVTPCDSNREGTLYISVAVPVKEQVKGMFNLLIELQNTYKHTCMTYDGAKYHFIARNDVDQPFEEIISRYATERYPYKTFTTSEDMTATAYLFMTTEQISDLLNDPMRSEFSRFGEIVLVPVADPSQHVSTLNVPAKIWRTYKIFVNGIQAKQTIADPTKTVTFTIPETERYEAASATFSINQIRENNTRGIVIDDEAQIIYLNLQQKEKPIVVKPEPPKNSNDNEPKKGLLPIIIGGICGVLLLAGVLFFVLSTGDDTEKDTQETVEGTDNPDQNKENGEKSDKEGTDNQSDSVKDANSGTSLIDMIKEEIGNNDPKEEGEKGEKAPKGNEVQKGDEGNVHRTQPDEVKGTDSNKNGKTESPEEKAKKQKEALKKQYEADKKAIENAGTLTFSKIDNIYRNRTNYTGFEEYQDFDKKVTFVHDEVESYIKKLSDNTVATDYKTKIKSLADQAQGLGLNGLAEKLNSRVKTPSQINESIKNNKSF